MGVVFSGLNSVESRNIGEVSKLDTLGRKLKDIFNILEVTPFSKPIILVNYNLVIHEF